MSDSLATPGTVPLQGPLSMGFPRQEYRRGLSLHSPGNLPHPGVKPASPALQVDSLLLSHQGSPIYSSDLMERMNSKSLNLPLSLLSFLLSVDGLYVPLTSFHLSKPNIGESYITLPFPLTIFIQLPNHLILTSIK